MLEHGIPTSSPHVPLYTNTLEPLTCCLPNKRSGPLAEAAGVAQTLSTARPT